MVSVLVIDYILEFMMMKEVDKMKTKVVVSLQVEGTHHWDGCNKAEVNYLAHEHRHVFHIKAKKLTSALLQPSVRILPTY